jgi:DUF4097 and DUF4098 domain-containing protein YvlB
MELNTREIRLMVLNILKDGRLTVDEADQIIDFITQAEEFIKIKEGSHSHTTEAIADFAKEGVAKIEKLVSGIGLNIEKVAHNIGQRINIKLDSNASTQAGEKFTFTETEEISSEIPVTRLVLENNWGGIKLIGEDRNNIELNTEKIIWTKNQDLANERSKGLKIGNVINEDTLQILLPTINQALNDTINLEIKVPKNIELELSSSSGDILVQDFRVIDKSINVKSNSGDIEIKQTTSKSIEIITISGDVSLKEIEGNIHARTTSGSLELEGNLYLDSRITTISGDIRGEVCVDDSLEVSSSSGNIEIKQHKNKNCQLLDLITNSGHINYKGIVQNTLRARSNSGSIKGASIVTNTAILEITTTSGDINWTVDEDSSLTFRCESKSGDIFTNLKGEEINKTSDSVIGKIKEGNAKLLLSTVSGDLKFHKE